MTALYLTWRQPNQRWWPVGRLRQVGTIYEFAYTQGALSAARCGFHPLSNFPDLQDTYASRELFPVFANRIPPKSRPDYQGFVEDLDLDVAGSDPIALLARSGGRRETDMFELFPAPEPNAAGNYEATFFVHGLRHRGPAAEEAARALRPGDALLLEPEPDNPVDPGAWGIRALAGRIHMGFVPRYLCDDIHVLRKCAGDGLRARVRRVNPPPTPAQFRLLCIVDAPWPPGFHPLSGPDFTPLSALIAAPPRPAPEAACDLGGRSAPAGRPPR